MKYIEYKERRTHGTPEFPLEFYHITPSHPRYEMSYHWHTQYELIRILKGEFLVTIDSKEFTARTGDIVFIHDGLIHGGLPKNCVYECIVFDLQSLLKSALLHQKQMQGILNHTLRVHYLFPNGNERLHKIIWGLFEAMRMKISGYELTVLGSFYMLFGCILEAGYYTAAIDSPDKNSKRVVQLKKALELIESSYASCITLNDLAKAAGMNSKYFCRFFQEMTHRTPIDYLNYYRIECACFQLATSDHSITEVALNCGFNDTSYFIKTFKKYKGLTPKKYLSAPLT